MTRKLLFFSLIFLFISCTVTKRVHRPGYYIQWHKIERTQSPEKQLPTSTKAKSTSSNQEVAARFQNTNSTDSASLQLNIEPEITSTVSIKPKKSKLTTQHSTITQRSNLERILRSKTKHARASSIKSARPILWRMNARTLKTIGIVLMCIGAMILFAALLVQWGAFSANGGGSGSDSTGGGIWLNFFLDLISLSGWFWLIVFILVFILVAYLFYLLVIYVLGGPIIGALVGLVFLGLGIFFYVLGKKREIDP